MKRIFCLCALTACLSIAAFADIRLPDTPTPTPAPKEKKAIETNMSIRLDKTASDARLIIPKSQLRQLRAALDELDGDTGSTAMNVTRTQTIVSGLFLSLAFVCGGVWFARARKTDGRINKTTAAATVIFLVGSAATIAFGNMGPPAQLRTISGDLFNHDTFGGWNTASGKIKLEVSDSDGMIQLVVPDKEKTKNKE